MRLRTKIFTLTKNSLIIIFLFWFGHSLGQTKDTLYVNGDTITLKQDSTKKIRLQTIVFRKPISKIDEEKIIGKKIDWDKVSSITQIIGTVLVFITLIFLVIQINIANKQTKISNEQAKIANKDNMLNSFEHIRDSINSYNDAIAQSSDLAGIILKARNSYISLTPEEKIRFEHVYGRLLNIIEAWYILLDETKLSEEFRNSQADNINAVVKYYFSFKGALEFWETYKPMYIPEVHTMIMTHAIVINNDDTDALNT